MGICAVIDLRSDLMAPRLPAVADAMRKAALRSGSMSYGEDADECSLNERLAMELGVEAVLLVPTCTMANQIAIRLHLPDGGRLATAPLAHLVTVEARATALTGVASHALAAENGHPTPEAVEQCLADRGGVHTLVWIENTHMLSAGSVIPPGWQERIAAACHRTGDLLHLDGSRLWNAAVARNAPMADLTVGCDTVSVSLNKALGAPVGSVLAGSRAAIEAAVRWREALGGEWRPLGSIAAAALASLEGWRERLGVDAEMTDSLAAALGDRLGEAVVQPAPTNLIFLNRATGDAPRFVQELAALGIGSTLGTQGIVRFALHSGVREAEVAAIADAVARVDALLHEPSVT